jgi:hypothetical protein
MPSYRFYKFCLSGWITVPLMIYSFFYLAFIPLDLPWWAALIIGFLCTIVCLFPLIAPLSPFVVCVVMLFGVILSLKSVTVFFYILCGAAVLYIARNFVVFRLAKDHPDISLAYDTAYRNGGPVPEPPTRQAPAKSRRWCLVAAVVLLALSISGNIFQFMHGKQVEGDLSDELSKLRQVHSQTCADYNAVKNDYDHIHDDYLFWVKFGAIAPDGSSQYHIFPDCADCDLTAFWIYNSEAAIDQGYKVCRFCSSRRSNLLN